MAWRLERGRVTGMQWGFTSNGNGVGTYIRLTKEIGGRYQLRKWSGNSIGFPHSGGAEGIMTFGSKKEAVAFAEKHMRKYPYYTKDGQVVNLDGTIN